ncbi:MAG: SIS domain-containing protein [Oscillospiraceae bacterium]|jgi:D-sedoheptulose 7-phosphate isomerase|nr:SIS domain-containing protein [Oscillospiraceae bacterium]
MSDMFTSAENTALDDAITACIRAFEKGGTLYICGNGGSAADCQHIVGELMKGFQMKRPVSLPVKVRGSLSPETAVRLESSLQGALPAHALTVETALISALCNDIDADVVYAQQIYGYGKPGDVLLCISTSGNAENVVLAAELAKAMGLTVVALTGRDGGKLAALCNIVIRAEADTTAEVQQRHLPMYHRLCREVEAWFYKL